jgi:hypothetical protein
LKEKFREKFFKNLEERIYQTKIRRKKFKAKLMENRKFGGNILRKNLGIKVFKNFSKNKFKEKFETKIY